MKRYFWLLYLLLVTVAAALAAEIVNAYISAQLAAPLKPTQTQASRTAGPLAQQAPVTHYEIIPKRNIFNATPPSDAPEPRSRRCATTSAPRSPGYSLAAEARGHHGGDGKRRRRALRSSSPQGVRLDRPSIRWVIACSRSLLWTFCLAVWCSTEVEDSRSSASKRMRGRHLPLELRHVQRQRHQRHQRHGQVTLGAQTSCALTLGPGRSDVRSSWRISPMWAPCHHRQQSRRTLCRGNSSVFACRRSAPGGYYSK